MKQVELDRVVLDHLLTGKKRLTNSVSVQNGEFKQFLSQKRLKVTLGDNHSRLGLPGCEASTVTEYFGIDYLMNY